MKQPNYSPVFAALYTPLCEIARELGYALAVHGTMALDFDLVAIPWTDQAVSGEELVQVLSKRLDLLSDTFGTGVDKTFEAKPHGRRAWLLYFGCGAQIDLSIMPRLQDKTA